MGILKLEDINYTYEDYTLWKGDWELIEGVPVAMTPAPVIRHQGIASEMIKEFGNQLDDCLKCEVLGEVDYKISHETVVRPDIVVTCGEESESYLIKAPEIIIEIVSPSSVRRDEGYKFKLYEKEKVAYYVLVYPEELNAKIYKLDGKQYDKQGDFSKERYVFEETTCSLSLDFKKVFKRFRE